MTVSNYLRLSVAHGHDQSGTRYPPQLEELEGKRQCIGNTSHVSNEYEQSMEKTYFKTRLIFLLLLVNYTKTEINFIGLFEIRLHAHDLRESFLRMFI
jgi:hypothetical protein